MATEHGQPNEDVSFDSEDGVIEVPTVRWLLPTTLDTFLKRLRALISRLFVIQTEHSGLFIRDFRRILNGRVEIWGDHYIDGQLAARQVGIFDLAISELEADRIEVTLMGQILMRHYVACREHLIALIDADYPGTQMKQVIDRDSAPDPETALSDSATGHVAQQLAQKSSPSKCQLKPWRPTFEIFASTSSQKILRVLDKLVTKYRLQHPEWLSRLKFRRGVPLGAFVDDFWPIVDVAIVEDDEAKRVGLSLTVNEYANAHDVPDANKFLALARGLGDFLKDELIKFYMKSDTSTVIELDDKRENKHHKAATMHRSRDIPAEFQEYPYPQLLHSIGSDEEKSQDARAQEIGYPGDRSEIARCIAKLGAAGLVDYKKHTRVLTLQPKGKEYLLQLKTLGKV